MRIRKPIRKPTNHQLKIETKRKHLVPVGNTNRALVDPLALLPVGNPSVPVSQPGARIREKRAPPLVPVSRPGLKVGNTNRG